MLVIYFLGDFKGIKSYSLLLIDFRYFDACIYFIFIIFIPCIITSNHMNITYLVLFRHAALLNSLNKKCDLLNYLIIDQSN